MSLCADLQKVEMDDQKDMLHLSAYDA